MTRPATTIMIAVLPDGTLEALALRAVLEAAGRQIDLRFIATPDAFRQIVAARPVPGLLVMCGHGADGGLYFGPLADSAGGRELANGFLMPDRFAGTVALMGCIVLSTACDSGTAGLARAFVQGGATAYIAPAQEPEGPDILLAVHIVLHSILQGLGPDAAVKAANDATRGGASLILHHGGAHAA